MDDALTLARRAAVGSYSWARAARPDAAAIVALHLGDAASALALGRAAQPERVIALDLGLATLARRFFASDRPGEAAIETAIAEVEDAIMPLRSVLPPEAWLVSTDAAVAAVAEQAGLSWQAGPATLDRDTVEALFHRWAALALGRPASQDALPIGGPGAGRFAATLLVLREWLHHLPQTALAVAPMASSPSAFSYPLSAAGIEP